MYFLRQLIEEIILAQTARSSGAMKLPGEPFGNRLTPTQGGASSVRKSKSATCDDAPGLECSALESSPSFSSRTRNEVKAFTRRNNDEPRGRRTLWTAIMYKAYFTRRLLEALSLAEQAESDEERSIHLRASRYYRDLIEAIYRHN